MTDFSHIEKQIEALDEGYFNRLDKAAETMRQMLEVVRAAKSLPFIEWHSCGLKPNAYADLRDALAKLEASDE